MKTIGGNQSARSLTTTWLTPRWILSELGDFDLDPCAAPLPRPWETAARSVSLPDDGLASEWTGRVWLNPPYSNAARLWLAKMAEHGNGTSLIFGRTDTAWFQDHVLAVASGIFFIRGRVRFCTPDGAEAKDNGGAPSVLVSYGGSDAKILEQINIPGKFVAI